MLKTSKDWLIKNRLFIEIGILSCLVLSVFGLILTFLKSDDNIEETSEMLSYLESESNYSMASNQVEQQSESQSEKIYIDVKGAVYLPGVYEVTSDMRLIDAIELAGGFSEKANQNPVNLSLKLTDQMVIFIPEVGAVDEKKSELETSAVPIEEAVITVPKEDSAAATSEKVNINLADSNELQQLPGIGEKKAEQIISYRQENGSFQKIEDLKNVSGIGEKTFEALRVDVTVGDGE
ncbi:helix-hairpin-helix domain-containing protein [Carnobacterium viridans]|uniref:Competence protein ComEA n=1 Tax=Carnobacterium viridans TaxID=174587 RepID=A0A1H0XQZ8_9LACT|nr:helix-hairpin-helix domain-containing protein [Carnobacterium viridans]UDE95595.1 helix-hairpin-helix domain-containing protein [Carnobacterium viridans]SDQ05334.1 competence protein ComEA [Carnobacterium viridans]